MMDRRECNDAGSKVNESNQDPFDLSRMRGSADKESGENIKLCE